MYPFLKERRGIWKEIARYIDRDIQRNHGDTDCCVEVGGGYCDFITQITAANKICYELNPDMSKFAEGVEFRNSDAIHLKGLDKNSVDLFLASNFLEHLDESELGILLPNILNCLKSGGLLVLIQPNYLLCPEHYFDDPTHKTIFDHNSIVSFLNAYKFDILRVEPNFLPFSMKSRLPKWPILVRLYLHSPYRPNAGQMYVLAQKR